MQVAQKKGNTSHQSRTEATMGKFIPNELSPSSALKHMFNN